MKRSGFTRPRTAGLPAGEPLRRTVPLRRGAPLRSVSPRAARPARARRGRDTGPTARTRRLVYRRCGAQPGHPGVCEWPGCSQDRTDLHHRLNRKEGGRYGEMAERLNGAAWLLACCPGHHRLVTSASGAELLLARESGWLLMEGQDGRRVSVLTRHHPGPIVLDNAGGWTVAR